MCFFLCSERFLRFGNLVLLRSSFFGHICGNLFFCLRGFSFLRHFRLNTGRRFCFDCLVGFLYREVAARKEVILLVAAQLLRYRFIILCRSRLFSKILRFCNRLVGKYVNILSAEKLTFLRQKGHFFFRRSILNDRFFVDHLGVSILGTTAVLIRRNFLRRLEFRVVFRTNAFGIVCRRYGLSRVFARQFFQYSFIFIVNRWLFTAA